MREHGAGAVKAEQQEEVELRGVEYARVDQHRAAQTLGRQQHAQASDDDSVVQGVTVGVGHLAVEEEVDGWGVESGVV